MPLPKPHAGLVISYSYLWAEEAQKEKEEGVKTRPCAIVLSRQVVEDEYIVTVVPITHTPPHDLDAVIEMSPALKEHLGLDDIPSWIVLSEVNHFIWPGPDLRPVPNTNPPEFTYGVLPPGYFRKLKEKLLTLHADRKLHHVRRTP